MHESKAFRTVYWGGAAFFLMADVALRERSQRRNSRSTARSRASHSRDRQDAPTSPMWTRLLADLDKLSEQRDVRAAWPGLPWHVLSPRWSPRCERLAAAGRRRREALEHADSAHSRIRYARDTRLALARTRIPSVRAAPQRSLSTASATRVRWASRELGRHRNRQHLMCGALGLWHVARLAAEIGEALLQVQAQRVVDLAGDMKRRERCAQGIAPAACAARTGCRRARSHFAEALAQQLA